ncbi:hypothetical protein [Azospirillum picis]|uniref:DUF1488 domain-containing protein n=1 Tax=Azospirillum picis TaxID=488438 RepID=A0ABU0MUN7_9PROT|nr:hypothetical protein [Azospirillum picis]MBP2303349.1 hypothetical protein [Azospirillum picis]MDQ0537190.1 hypothetical protein [Azospirillum picis]
MTADGPVWRSDIDALVFRPAGHGGWCAVHRLAFRALLGRRDPAPEDCLAHAVARRDAFDRAAAEKIRRRGLDAGDSLHLTSRDVERACG